MPDSPVDHSLASEAAAGASACSLPRSSNIFYWFFFWLINYSSAHTTLYHRVQRVNPVALMAEEREIRAEIGSVIRNLNVENYNFSDFNNADFEFMQVVAKNVQIPDTSPLLSVDWSGCQESSRSRCTVCTTCERFP